jgi:hypothetical protein
MNEATAYVFRQYPSHCHLVSPVRSFLVFLRANGDKISVVAVTISRISKQLRWGTKRHGGFFLLVGLAVATTQMVCSWSSRVLIQVGLLLVVRTAVDERRRRRPRINDRLQNRGVKDSERKDACQIVRRSTGKKILISFLFYFLFFFFVVVSLQDSSRTRRILVL